MQHKDHPPHPLQSRSNWCRALPDEQPTTNFRLGIFVTISNNSSQLPKCTIFNTYLINRNRLIMCAFPALRPGGLGVARDTIRGQSGRPGLVTSHIVRTLTRLLSRRRIALLIATVTHSHLHPHTTTQLLLCVAATQAQGASAPPHSSNPLITLLR